MQGTQGKLLADPGARQVFQKGKIGDRSHLPIALASTVARKPYVHRLVQPGRSALTKPIVCLDRSHRKDALASSNEIEQGIDPIAVAQHARSLAKRANAVARHRISTPASYANIGLSRRSVRARTRSS